MLLPPSHAWTPVQKRLITATIVLAVVSVGALVYGYERYHRGPSESILYGTWQFPLGEHDAYFQFNPDQTFSLLNLFEGQVNTLMKGRWYAGGPNIYLRFSAEDLGQRRPIILHILNIEPNELRVRMWGNDVWIYKRVNLNSQPVSNQLL